MAVARSTTLLATTALEESWGTQEPLVFLGEWCKRYERAASWGAREHVTLPYHWDDREKLDRDYRYLEQLHGRLLAALAAGLDELHGVRQSVRYWQILLDPWLLTYLGVAFDRWETVRLAFEHGTLTDIVAHPAGEWAPAAFSYAEFIVAVMDDDWNQRFYERIIRSEQPGCVVRTTSAPPPGRVAVGHSPAPGRVERRSLAFRLDRLLSRFQSRYDVVLLGSTFNLRALVRLNLALRQVPRLHLHEFGVPVSEADLRPSTGPVPERGRLAVRMESGSAFESFVLRSLLNDLPLSVIEHYDTLRRRARELRLHARTIVTGGHHWSDVSAKFWFAEQVSAGAKLVVAEHGGGLPPRRELFEFEENIADVKATWFTAHHHRHRQLPPAKIVERFREARGRQAETRDLCAIIGNECPRWAIRAQYYPHAGQWQPSFDMVLQLVRALDVRVQSRVGIKPYPSDAGWNTRRRFEDALGADRVLAERSLDRVFARARVVVCTYPETTFAEAMASGVPTLLVYPPELYELNPVTHALLDQLRAARIVFHDAVAAAAQVSRIWDDPDAWWSSPEVAQARAEFARAAGDVDGDWVRRWADFLNTVTAA